MSGRILSSLFTTTALSFALPSVAIAQDVPAGAEEITDTGEIIVTARREAESLQDVPVSVQVVTGDSIQKLAITSADEISKLAPGLTLVNQGAATVVTLRGVTWQPGSGTPATPIYFNEVPFDPQNTITSLFDIGQIEVLRGPQGTTRGAPSISGAVTISTRKPNLEEFGGYVQAAYGTADRWNAQGAVNVPIIKEKLAIRLAAFAETNDNNRIYSVNSSVQPSLKDRTYRATLLFQPTDTLSLSAMYQRRKTAKVTYTQVAGTGSPGFPGIPGRLTALRANFNGPALTVQDRASVQDLPSRAPEHVDLLTVNASWEVFGHQLSYNFGRQFNRTGSTFNANDPLNILPGYEPFNFFFNKSLPKWTSHEIRLSSMPDPDRPFDYDIGWFSKHSGGTIVFNVPVFLPGAFGPPGAEIPGAVTTPVSRYMLNTSLNIAIGQVFDSFYGNVRFHLSDRTELTGGLSIVRDRVPVQNDLTVSGGFFPFANPAAPFLSCSQIGFTASPVYGGFCDSVVAPSVFPSEIFNNKYTAALYNVSLSHKFTDNLLVYLTTGSSFRTGLPAINNPGLPANLLTPAPEKAKSYEVGVKASLNRRLRVSAAAFQLDYADQLTSFQGISYFVPFPAPGRILQTFVAFYRNIDSRVRGFEVEVAAEPIENLSLAGNISYSRITSKGGAVPCNDGVARPLSAANPMNFCPSAKGEVLNQSPPFQATVSGSYDLPIGNSFGGYFRFNANYRGKNPNFRNFGVPAANGTITYRKTPGYAVVDLFAGLSGNDGGWDVGFYAKNVFDKQVELGRVVTTNSIFGSFAAPSGYDVVGTSQPREVGVTARFAFGSR